LNELYQIVLEDDLAGRDGDIAADLEGIEVGHLDHETTLAAIQILEHVLQPVDEILALGVDGRAQHLGIGQNEIRWRDRVDELPRVEIDLARGFIIEPVDLLHRRLQPARREQVALLDVIEERVLLPGGVLEAAVAWLGLGDRRRLAAEKALCRARPEAHIVLP